MPRFRWEDYLEMFGDKTILTRADLAKMFGVGGTTARYHLERAVDAGALNKQYGWVGGQSGWLYGLPSSMPRLEGL